MIPTQAIPVFEMSQAGQVRRAATTLAKQIGFDSDVAGRVSLVATEAATNLVKHAQRGEIVLAAVPGPQVRAIDIVALDRGPGIQDLDRALRDGFSTGGGMGMGLGAIRRMASRFDLYSAESGTILFARVGSNAASEAGGVEIGAVQVPYPGEELSGDAWAAAHAPGYTKVFVVDGLGHGADANTAAQLAVQIFTRYSSDAPVALLQRIHDGLRPTRGAAGAVLELDHRARLARFAGIGNTAASILVGDSGHSMVSHHGVLGHTARKLQEFTYPWPPRALVVLHSDGIASHWDLARYPGLERRYPALIAAALYRDFNRGRDDATVIAVREAA